MTEFEFVVQTGTHDGKHAARRTVRSQAMKAFRERQRQERTALQNAQILAPRELKSKQESPSGALASSEATSRHPAAGLLTWHLEKSDSPGSTVPRRLRRKPFPGGGMIHESGLSSRSVSPMSRSPAVWTSDPFSSPSDVGQMICFCAAYVNWLRPDLTVQHAATVCEKAWATSQCAMLLSACCMAAAVDLNNASQSLDFHKSRILKELADRMVFSETATSDETISALVFLASAELSKASAEARIHLRGLNMVLCRRFGSHNGYQVPDARFSRVVQTLELTLAMMFDEHLFVPELSELSLHRVCDQINDILVGEQLEYLAQGEDVCQEMMSIKPIFTLINNAFGCMSILTELPASGHAASQAFWNTLEEFRRDNCTEGSPAGAVVRPAARACYHSMAILYNLVSNARPYRHSSNNRHVAGLTAALAASSEQSWRHLPFLQLFAILTGLTSARDQGSRGRLKRHLWSSIFATLKWRKTRRFMLLFIVGRDKLHAVFSPQAGHDLETQPSSDSFPTAPPSSEKTSVMYDLDSTSRQWPSQVHTAMRTRRSAQEMLCSDHRFHQVIRDGGCWLTEIE